MRSSHFTAAGSTGVSVGKSRSFDAMPVGLPGACGAVGDGSELTVVTSGNADKVFLGEAAGDDSGLSVTSNCMSAERGGGVFTQRWLTGDTALAFRGLGAGEMFGGVYVP